MKYIVIIVEVLFLAFHFAFVRACTLTDPCAFTGRGGDQLMEPTEHVSSGGALSVTLNVDIADITIDWLTLHRRVYNGQIPGPTWRVKKGDVVTVTLNNNLQLPHKDQAINQLRFPNSTNLHTHGLHISSQEPEDNVFVHVNPASTYTYVYNIDPENPAGTYWYHPHLHGSTMLQVHSGLAGMIIVEDTVADMPVHLADVSCPNNCDHDVQLLFQPVLQYINNAGRGFANIQRQIEENAQFRHNQYTTTSGQTLEAWLEDATNGVNHFTTNGQIFPSFNVTTGQTKRFRMVNAGGSSSLELMIVNRGTRTAATGCTFKEIAFDGVYLDSARTPALGKTFIPPSSKADWLVVCNTAGTYEVRSVVDQNDINSIGNFERLDDLLLTIYAEGSTTTTALGTTLPTRESFVQDFRSYTQDQVQGRFIIEASSGTRLNRELFSSNTDYRFKSELGTVQEWYLINTDPNLGHPIHIHINHFQVISYNPYTGPVAAGAGPGAGPDQVVYYDQSGQLCHHQSSSYIVGQVGNLPRDFLQFLGHDTRWQTGGSGTLGYVAAGEFRDVIVVPPLVNITIRFMTHTYTGEVVIHCHILNHEDTGMMMTTDIVNPGQSLTANTLSGTAYPGQCAMCDPFPFNQDTSNCSTTAIVATASDMSLYYLFFLLAIPIIAGVVAAVMITSPAAIGATAVGSSTAAAVGSTTINAPTNPDLNSSTLATQSPVVNGGPTTIEGNGAVNGAVNGFSNGGYAYTLPQM